LAVDAADQLPNLASIPASPGVVIFAPATITFPSPTPETAIANSRAPALTRQSSGRQARFPAAQLGSKAGQALLRLMK
jgi:hypothetical protein